MSAKLRHRAITTDWYKEEFLEPSGNIDEIIIRSGLNKKTIANSYNTTKREIAFKAAVEHYDSLYRSIAKLIDEHDSIDITLTITFNNVSVELNINESLIVVNALAVKRAQLRGGAWSTTGKQVEKPLMVALCELYDVPTSHHTSTGLTSERREIDFNLIGLSGKTFKCEVKLMGKGNPESADATIARDTDVFVADKLSDTNKSQLDSRGVKWVELRDKVGFRRFETILTELGVPHRPLPHDVSAKIEALLG